MSIPIDPNPTPVSRFTGDFELPRMSLEDYENNVFIEYINQNNHKSRAVFHISLSPYNLYLQIIFRGRPNRLKVLYKYPLRGPRFFIMNFEQFVIDFDSIGETIQKFKENRWITVFERYYL